MRRLKLALQIIGGVVVVGVLILVGTTLLLNTNTVQDKVVDWSVDALKERLGTQVQVDSARVNLFNQKVELYGVGIEDQKQRKMLQIEQIEKLSARAELMSLRHDEVKISDVSIKGCQALIVKNDSDLLPNYQFIIDSLKQKVAESVQPADKPKKKMKVDIDNISIDDVSVTYNGNLYHLGRLEYQQKADGTSVDCRFADVNAEQSIIIPELVETSYVMITILDVYRGTQCDDTCIYQVKAYEMTG